MAEASFKQMIATFIRQTRPRSFRCGKPPRYPQRSVASFAPSRENTDSINPSSQWQSHSLPPHGESSVPSTRLAQLRDDPHPRAFSSFLTDNYAREHNYLRISVTERCNLRCVYCMPEEGVPLSPPTHNLTTPEIVYLSSLFVSQGVDKIRLTGGEPTVRKDIVDLMHQIGRLRRDGLKELCLTTNGISLHRKLDSMVAAGLTGVNLSLDTLDRHQFTIMTRRNGHEAVMKSIQRILEMNKAGAGIKLKINCVVMRGINEREIIPFVEMGQEQDLEVRFIEYMPFEGNKWSQKKMLSFQEMLGMIQEKYPGVQKVQGHTNDTSKTYQIPGFTGRIGFITSMTHNFCGTCNRLRITSDGNLKVCLFGNNEVSLRDILRQSNDGHPIDAEAMEAIKQIEMDRRESTPGFPGAPSWSNREQQLLEVIGTAVRRKKEKHAGMGELENMKNRPMILIDALPHVLESSFQNPTDILLQHKTKHLSDRSPWQYTNVPVHLVTPRFVASSVTGISMGSHRGMSTQPYFRKVRGQSAFRRVAHSSGRHKSQRRTKREEAYMLGPSRPESGNQIETDSDLSVPIALETVHSVEHPEPDDGAYSNSLQQLPKLTHLTSTGEAHMVDISGKQVTSRSATAHAVLFFSNENTYQVLQSSTHHKGDALAVARIAGIQAAKKTSDLIPLAHPGLGLTSIKIHLKPFLPRSISDSASRAPGAGSHETKPSPLVAHYCGGVTCQATVACEGKTGVEMEALTSATVAALTMYDMLKGVDKAMRISSARVLSKRGGKSGDWHYDSHKGGIIYGSSHSSSSVEQDRSTNREIATDSDTIQDVHRALAPTMDQTAGRSALTDRGPFAVADGQSNNATEQREAPNPSTRQQMLNKVGREAPSSDRATQRITFRPKTTEHLLAVKHLRLREQKLRVEKEKLRLQREDFLLEQQKIRLSATNIEEEVQRRLQSHLEKTTLYDEYGTPSQHEGGGGGIPSTTSSTFPLPSSLVPDAAVKSPRLSESQQSHTYPVSRTGLSPGLSPLDIDSPDSIKFDRVTRSKMSGTWSDRADSHDFETKRMERYDDWAKGR